MQAVRRSGAKADCRNGGQKIGNLRSETEKIGKLLSIALFWFFAYFFSTKKVRSVHKISS